jgi:hypothetical protein
MHINTQLTHNNGPDNISSSTPTNDYLGLDSAIEKLRTDLQRMNTPNTHHISSGNSVGSDGTGTSKAVRKFSSVGRARTASNVSGGGDTGSVSSQTSATVGGGGVKLWENVNKE